MSLPSLYPFSFIVKRTIPWAIGNDPCVLQKYQDWFTCIITSTVPSLAGPVPMTSAQKKSVRIPVTLFLGTNDPIVGDAGFAAETAREYPDIQIEILESGHLIAIEEYEFVNKKVSEFLGI